MAEMKDFSKARKDISFRIDDDIFHAARAIPADVLMDFAAEFSGMDEKAPVDEQLKAFRAVLEFVLLPESLERFSKRLRDPENPVEVDQVEGIITWLMEEYGLRPIELPSSSVDGQAPPGPGTTLTATTPAEVSISAASPSTAS